MYGSIRELRSGVFERLGDGEHPILYGPRGSGKSRLLAQCTAVSAVEDSVRNRALNFLSRRHHPGIAERLPRREHRGRESTDRAIPTLERGGPKTLCAAAGSFLEGQHRDSRFFAVSSWRHRRRAVCDRYRLERERMRLRKRARSPALSVRMPLASTAQLRALLHTQCVERGFSVEPEAAQLLVRTVQGRPGWIVLCTALISHARYWHGHLYPSLLCTDTEISLRQGTLTLLPPEGWSPACGRAWSSPLTGYDEEAFWSNSRPSPPRKAY